MPPTLLEGELCRFPPVGVTREEGNRTVRKMYIPYGYGDNGGSNGLMWTKARLLGWTEMDSGSGNLLRHLPWKDPDQETQYCVEVNHEGIGYGRARADAPTPTVPFKTKMVVQKWRITAQFSTLPYSVGVVDTVIEDDIRGVRPADETTRFASKKIRLGRDYINPPTGSFFFEGIPGAIPIPIPAILPFQEIQAIWYQIPIEGYPVQAIEACLGKVNGSSLTLPAFPDNKTSYATETMHLLGVAVEPTFSPFGARTCNIHYDFRFRGGGGTSWNHFPRSTTSGITMTRIVRGGPMGTKGLFDTANFSNLFKTNPAYVP